MHQTRVLRTLDSQTSARFARGLCMALGIMNPSLKSRRAVFALAAFAVSALVPALSLSLVGALSVGFERLDVVDVAMWTLIFYLYAALAICILGVPSFLVLRKVGAINWWSALLSGLFLGVAALAIFVPSEFGPRGIMAWGAMGAISAFVFWLIWRQGHIPAPVKT